MAGSVSFPLTVEIAFSNGPMDTSLTWTDVSAYVRRNKTISLSRGYDPETDEPMAGRGQLQLANDDGRFTPGKTGVYGLIRNKLPIRVKRSSTVLWTGVIEKLAMSYDAGMRPVVDVTCVDRWARLQARKFTADRITPAVTALSPTHYWPFTDVSGSTRAVDTVAGTDFVPLTASALTFSVAGNPQAGNNTNVLSSTGTTMAGSQTLMAASPTNWTFSAWLNNALVQFRWTNGYVDLDYRSSSQSIGFQKLSPLTNVYYTSPSFVSGWHHLVLTGSVSAGTTTAKMYLDGVLVKTMTTSANVDGPLTDMYVSGTGIAYVSTHTSTLTDSDIKNMSAAAIPNLLGGDTADTRANRIKAINGGWTLTNQGTFTSTMSGPSWTDKSVATTLNECAQAEAGTIFIDRDGWPVMQSRSYRTTSTVAATIPAKVLAAEATWELDDQALCNVVQVDRMALDVTATTINRRNETSIASYDEAGKSLALWLNTDEQAVDRANAEVNQFATPFPRSRTFAVNIATCQAVISEATILGIDVSSRIKISGLPATAPVATDAGWYVEAIEDSISHTEWVRTFTVSPALDYWVLEDATYGALDSTFVLAY